MLSSSRQVPRFLSAFHDSMLVCCFVPPQLEMEKAVPVSDLCEELGLQTTVLYRWQPEFFENGAAAFQSTERPHRLVEEKQKRIEFLEKKVQTKDEVLPS